MSLHGEQKTAFARNHLIQEFQESCAPRQRMLLSLLTICDKHDLEPSQLVADLAVDLPRTPLESRRRTRKFYWARVEDYSDQLNESKDPMGAMQEFPELLPPTVRLGLELAKADDTCDELTDLWLNRPPDDIYDLARTESFVARMIPLFLKAFIIFQLVAFILIKIVPEFHAMMEEFGVEVPAIFHFSMRFFDSLVHSWFIPVLLALIAILFCFPAFRQYFRRWNPFVWKKRLRPSFISTRQALAMVEEFGARISNQTFMSFEKLARALQTGQQQSEAVDKLGFDWDRLAAQKIITQQESRALNIAESRAARSWLLRKAGARHRNRLDTRGAIFSRSVVTFVNIVLGIMVFLMAITVFSVLISIMAHMQ